MEQDNATRVIIIRPARPEEAPALTQLALRSKAYWGYGDAFMAACVDELTVTAGVIREQPTFVAEDGGHILGFYVLEPLGEDAVELAFLFVEPATIGQGHGRRLVRHAKATAMAGGYHALIIQGDPNAAGFYRAMGADLIGSRPSASIPGRELPLFQIDLSRGDVEHAP